MLIKFYYKGGNRSRREILPKTNSLAISFRCNEARWLHWSQNHMPQIRFLPEPVNYPRQYDVNECKEYVKLCCLICSRFVITLSLATWKNCSLEQEENNQLINKEIISPDMNTQCFDMLWTMCTYYLNLTKTKTVVSSQSILFLQ